MVCTLVLWRTLFVASRSVETFSPTAWSRSLNGGFVIETVFRIGTIKVLTMFQAVAILTSTIMAWKGMVAVLRCVV